MTDKNRKTPHPTRKNVFGGKITTYRKLAESALDKLSGFFSNLPSQWTQGVALSGGDFAFADRDKQCKAFSQTVPMIEAQHAHRLFHTYGLEAFDVFSGVHTSADVGKIFAPSIYARELDWAVGHEWVRSAEDFLWRRSKQGLHSNQSQVAAIEKYIQRICKEQGITY